MSRSFARERDAEDAVSVQNRKIDVQFKRIEQLIEQITRGSYDLRACIDQAKKISIDLWDIDHRADHSLRVEDFLYELKPDRHGGVDTDERRAGRKVLSTMLTQLTILENAFSCGIDKRVEDCMADILAKMKLEAEEYQLADGASKMDSEQAESQLADGAAGGSGGRA